MLFHCKETAAVRKHFWFLPGQKRLLAVYLSLGFRRFIKQFQPKAVKDLKVNPSLCNKKMIFRKAYLDLQDQIKKLLLIFLSEVLDQQWAELPWIDAYGQENFCFLALSIYSSRFHSRTWNTSAFLQTNCTKKIFVTKYPSLSAQQRRLLWIQEIAPNPK